MPIALRPGASTHADTCWRVSIASILRYARDMISITPEITIPEEEIEMEFMRASGPGGQRVNKVSTAVQLRFDVLHSPSLPDDVRQRLMRMAGKRITKEGVLILEARRYRTQERNRQDAIERFVDLVRRAATRPKVRRRVRPPLASKVRRLEQKRRRGVIKRLRRRPKFDD
jgi:ribosome-associated protein